MLDRRLGISSTQLLLGSSRAATLAMTRAAEWRATATCAGPTITSTQLGRRLTGGYLSNGGCTDQRLGTNTRANILPASFALAVVISVLEGTARPLMKYGCVQRRC